MGGLEAAVGRQLSGAQPPGATPNAPTHRPRAAETLAANLPNGTLAKPTSRQPSCLSLH